MIRIQLFFSPAVKTAGWTLSILRIEKSPSREGLPFAFWQHLFFLIILNRQSIAREFIRRADKQDGFTRPRMRLVICPHPGTGEGARVNGYLTKMPPLLYIVREVLFILCPVSRVQSPYKGVLLSGSPYATLDMERNSLIILFHSRGNERKITLPCLPGYALFFTLLKANGKDVAIPWRKICLPRMMILEKFIMSN